MKQTRKSCLSSGATVQPAQDQRQSSREQDQKAPPYQPRFKVTQGRTGERNCTTQENSGRSGFGYSNTQGRKLRILNSIDEHTRLLRSDARRSWRNHDVIKLLSDHASACNRSPQMKVKPVLLISGPEFADA